MNESLLILPGVSQVGTGEVRPLGFDVSHLMAEGDTISDVAHKMVDVETGADVTAGALLTTPVVEDPVITQPITGAGLAAGGKYRVELTFTLTLGKRLTVARRVDCPF